MDSINFNKILDREVIANNIYNFLRDFELNKKDLLKKRGIYIYGESGILSSSGFFPNSCTLLHTGESKSTLCFQ